MIELRRTAIERLSPQKSESINPSLWLQKGLKEKEEDKDKPLKEEDNPKTKHLKELVGFKCDLYPKAYNRWFDLISAEHRFSQTVMTLENRLLIGLTGNGALETGCSLSRNYGMPYIPSSSVKGVVRAWVEQHLKDVPPNEIAELFGTRDSEHVNRVSGLVTFHDAWWIPFDKDKAKPEPKPFVLDVVTTHHQAYYNSGQAEPSDKDSPIPNHQLAVQGSFLFVIEGAPEHVELCQKMLVQALQDNGIGAKTAAGYGYMDEDAELLDFLVEESLPRVPEKIRIQREEAKQRKAELVRQQQEAEQQRIEQEERDRIEQMIHAENAKTVEQVCSELNTDYENMRSNEEYIQKLEERIDYVIQNWRLEDRFSLAKCLNDIGYIPKNKKNKNHEVRKERLQQLRGR